jgi:hypothetical protein
MHLNTTPTALSGDCEARLMQVQPLQQSLLAEGADYAQAFGASAREYSEWLTAERLPRTTYRVLPERCQTLFNRVVANHGIASGELFLQLVATYELLGLPGRLRKYPVPASVLPWIERCVTRLVDDLTNPRTGYFSHDNDPFAKDLAVCRLEMLPCGVEMVDLDTGFARSEIWKHGRNVFWKLGKAFLEMGGNTPLMGSHVDRRAIREFSVEGYRRFYHRVADILRVRPNLRGMMSQSWLLDPALQTISPELGYLYAEPAAANAVFFPAYGDDRAVADALRLSPHRRKLHEAGQYQPCSYVMIWPRHALLKWSEQHPLPTD